MCVIWAKKLELGVKKAFSICMMSFMPRNVCKVNVQQTSAHFSRSQACMWHDRKHNLRSVLKADSFKLIQNHHKCTNVVVKLQPTNPCIPPNQRTKTRRKSICKNI